MSGLKNWKTTAAGIVTAVIIAVYPLIQGQHVSAQQIAHAVAVAALGWLARDSGGSGQ